MKGNISLRVQNELARIAEECGTEKLVLFGSRARAQNRTRSDIDIAVSGGNFDDFYFSVKENTHTLLSFDIINLDEHVSSELLTEIKKDGIVIYEKA